MENLCSVTESSKKFQQEGTYLYVLYKIIKKKTIPAIQLALLLVVHVVVYAPFLLFPL